MLTMMSTITTSSNTVVEIPASGGLASLETIKWNERYKDLEEEFKQSYGKIM